MYKMPEWLNQWEQEQLAELHVRVFIEEMLFEFFTGWSANSCIGHHVARFDEIAIAIGEEKKQDIVDRLENQFHRSRGDAWEAFKSTCNPSFFSTPPDLAAIRRLAEDLPNKNWDEIEEFYSMEYADVLRSAIGGEESKTEFNGLD